jgi:hypothetical protein
MIRILKNPVTEIKNFQGEKLKINILPIFMTVLILLSLQCSSPQSLSETEKAKLDSYLIHLFAGEPVDKNLVGETLRSDGSKEYAVIVQSEHSEEIKALGISMSSVFGDVIVVHATLDEMRKLISLPSVRSIHTGSRNKIQQH